MSAISYTDSNCQLPALFTSASTEETQSTYTMLSPSLSTFSKMNECFNFLFVMSTQASDCVHLHNSATKELMVDRIANNAAGVSCLNRGGRGELQSRVEILKEG